MIRQVSVEGRPVHSPPLCWIVGYLSAALVQTVVDELYSEAPECGYVLECVEYPLLLPLSLPPSLQSRARAAGKKHPKKRGQRATSNIFAMFDQAQIQEFKEVRTTH